MKWIINFNNNKIFRRKYWFYSALQIFAEILALIPPIITGIIIDEGLIGGNFSYGIKLAVILIVLVLFCKILFLIGSANLNRYCYDLAKDIRVACYNKLSYLDRTYFNKTDIGEVSTILTSDIRTIRSYLEYTVRAFISMILTFTITFIYGLKINALLIISILVVTPFMVIFYRRYYKNLVNYMMKKETYFQF